LFLFS